MDFKPVKGFPGFNSILGFKICDKNQIEIQENKFFTPKFCLNVTKNNIAKKVPSFINFELIYQRFYIF